MLLLLAGWLAAGWVAGWLAGLLTAAAGWLWCCSGWLARCLLLLARCLAGRCSLAAAGCLAAAGRQAGCCCPGCWVLAEAGRLTAWLAGCLRPTACQAQQDFSLTRYGLAIFSLVG